MTALDLHRTPDGEPSRQVADLVAWADSARAAASIATSLVRTSFVPEAFRGKPEEATAAILSGAEVGLSPMASLRSFDVIQGSAAARAITLRAIVQSAGHQLWTEESTETRAVVCGRRNGQEQVERSVWTLPRAAKLKLTGKANWQNQPQAMLLARATAECARLVAADAILGIPYASEELEDLEPTPTTTVARADRPKTTVRRAVAPVPDEPSLDEGPEQDVPARPVEDRPLAVEPITAAQLKKLHVMMGERGLTDRDLGLAFLSEAVLREIASSKDLTKDEARFVIDQLEHLTALDEQPSADPDPEWPDVPAVDA